MAPIIFFWRRPLDPGRPAAEKPTLPKLTISLLGPPQIELDGAPIEVDTRKAIALIAYLAMAEEPQSRSSLAAMLWPDSDEQRARTALRRTLAALNKGIGKDWIEANRATLALLPHPDLWIDVHQFEAAVKAGRRQAGGGDPAGCARVSPDLKEGLALYRGEFLEGFTLSDSVAFDEWQSFESGRLRHEASEGFHVLVRCCRILANHEDGIRFSRRWLQLDPLHEPAIQELMRLYALAGQRSAALQQYETCLRLLNEELGVPPQEETVELHRAILSGEFPPKQPEMPAAAPPPAAQLPRQLTSFIGRLREQEEIQQLLEDPERRLVTVIGPGGIGKTRLAIEVAAASRDHYAHGVYFVPLGPVSSADYLVATLADTLHFTFYGGPGNNDVLKGQLLDYLREKNLLLVLDNFEHVLEGAGLVAEILANAPRIQVLATSQERLNLLGEWLVEIQGLECPQGKDGDIRACSAVQLFVQRARQMAPDFSLAAGDEPHVAQICHMVGGLPLGIELAATWVRLLSCQEIAGQIEKNLDFLAAALRNLPDRHRSLRAVFEHSWQLLSEDERRHFRTLSVFHGGFRASAAEEVVGAPLPLLLALVNKSLLHRNDDGRYETNQVLHQYAREKFQGELDQEKREQVQEQHGRYFAQFLVERAPALRGAGQSTALREIGEEIVNVRQAWRWAIAGRHLAVIDQMLEPLYRFYETRSWFQEGAAAFGQAITLLEDEPAAEQLALGRLLSREGRLWIRLSELGRGRESLERSLAILREFDTAAEIVAVLGILGVTADMEGDYELARRRQEESLALARQIEDPWGEANALLRLGNVSYGEGRYLEARAAYADSLALRRRVDDRRGIAVCLNNLGSIADTLGEYEEAVRLYGESLVIKKELGDRRGIAYSYNNLGYVKCLLGTFDAAEEDLLESLALFREIGDRKGIAYSLTNLGNVAFGRQKYREALTLYRQSLETSQTFQFKLGTAYALNHIGSTCHRLGDVEEAWKAFLDALETIRKIKATPVALEILVEIAALLVDQEDWGRAALILAGIRRHPSSRKNTLAEAAPLWEAVAAHLPDADLAAAEAAAGREELLDLVSHLLAPHGG